jgi:EmrB/QacA subfamily drug resistance transporter
MTPLANHEITSGVIRDKGHQRSILLATCAALMAVIASVSGLNVAQQEIAIELAASQTAVLWIVNAYTVALAAMLLPVGAVGDRWGRRPILLGGLALFVAASVASAMAPTVALMICARLASGIAAAMIMPVTLSVITSHFPEEDRPQAIGIWTAVAGGGGLLGMFVAAVLVDLSSWRWLFMPVIAFAGIAWVGTWKHVPNSRTEPEGPFDVAGSLLAVSGVGGLVLAIHEGPVRGWTEPLTLGLLFAGLASIAAFTFWELRSRAPLFDVRVFADRRLAAGSVTLVCAFAVLGGIMVVLFLYSQAVLGWSALRSMAGMMPMALAMMASSVLASRAVARLGLRTTMLAGIGIAATGIAGMAMQASTEGGYWSIAPWLATMAGGFGLAMTPSTESIARALPATRQGIASALNDATREFGTALGVASLGAVLASRYAGAIRTRLKSLPPEVADAVAEGISTATVVADGGGDRGLILSAAREAFIEGWGQSMWVGLTVTVLLFLFVLSRSWGPSETARNLATPLPQTSPMHSAPLHIGVVTSGETPTWIDASASDVELMRRLTKYLLPRSDYQLGADPTRRFRELASRGAWKEAVAVYFAAVGERWDREALILVSRSDEVVHGASHHTGGGNESSMRIRGGLDDAMTGDEPL